MTVEDMIPAVLQLATTALEGTRHCKWQQLEMAKVFYMLLYLCSVEAVVKSVTSLESIECLYEG